MGIKIEYTYIYLYTFNYRMSVLSFYGAITYNNGDVFKVTFL
jgi:hypothetical protein